MALLSALLVIGGCVLAAHAGDSSMERACHCTQNIGEKLVKRLVETTISDLLEDVASVYKRATYAQPCSETNVCKVLMGPDGSNSSGYCVNLKNNLKSGDEVAAQACVLIRQTEAGFDASGNYLMAKSPDGKTTWAEGSKLCRSTDYCNAAANLQAAILPVALVLSSFLTVFLVSR